MSRQDQGAAAAAPEEQVHHNYLHVLRGDIYLSSRSQEGALEIRKVLFVDRFDKGLAKGIQGIMKEGYQNIFLPKSLEGVPEGYYATTGVLDNFYAPDQIKYKDQDELLRNMKAGSIRFDYSVNFNSDSGDPSNPIALRIARDPENNAYPVFINTENLYKSQDTDPKLESIVTAHAMLITQHEEGLFAANADHRGRLEEEAMDILLRRSLGEEKARQEEERQLQAALSLSQEQQSRDNLNRLQDEENLQTGIHESAILALTLSEITNLKAEEKALREQAEYYEATRAIRIKQEERARQDENDIRETAKTRQDESENRIALLQEQLDELNKRQSGQDVAVPDTAYTTPQAASASASREQEESPYLEIMPDPQKTPPQAEKTPPKEPAKRRALPTAPVRSKAGGSVDLATQNSAATATPQQRSSATVPNPGGRKGRALPTPGGGRRRELPTPGRSQGGVESRPAASPRRERRSLPVAPRRATQLQDPSTVDQGRTN